MSMYICPTQENSSNSFFKYIETLQSKDKKNQKKPQPSETASFPCHAQKHPMMGNTSWHLLFSIRLFGKVKHSCSTVGGVSRDMAIGDSLGRTPAALQDLLLTLMTLDHSVPQTWFFLNPRTGNANVFFLSFWLISKITWLKGLAWKTFLWCWQNWENIPPTTHSHIYLSLLPDNLLQAEAITARNQRR